jgi:hypothetical protein
MAKQVTKGKSPTPAKATPPPPKKAGAPTPAKATPPPPKKAGAPTPAKKAPAPTPAKKVPTPPISRIEPKQPKPTVNVPKLSRIEPTRQTSSTPTRSSTSSPSSLRAEEFRNPALAEAEVRSPSRAPSNTTQQRNIGAGSTPSPNTGGSGGGNNYNEMLNALSKLSTMSQGTINTSMDDLANSLRQQVNPFQNFQAQQTATTPELSQLLAAQGVNKNPLEQFASAINAQNTGQATAFNNLAGMLGGINTQMRNQNVTDIEQRRAELLNSLQGNIFGAGQQLMGKDNIQQGNIVRMLLAGLGNRA